MEIIEIPKRCAAQIIFSRKPMGAFLMFDEFQENPWVAIDNTTGDAFTEEFKTKRQAIKWLKEGSR